MLKSLPFKQLILKANESSLRRSLKFWDRAACLHVYCYHGLAHQRRDSRLERNFHLVSEFQEQVRFLQRQSVMSLPELNASLAGESDGGGRQMAAITFDDGYKNNLLAQEILSQAGLPFAIFVSTAAAGPGKAIWTVELSLLLLHGCCDKVEALGQAWPRLTREERETTFQSIRYQLKALPAALRQKTMDVIRAQFPSGETQRLLQEFPSFQMLSWAELRQFAAAGVEIGSHGVDHEIHHSSQESEVRRRELVESKMEIERQVGKPCRFFAFPNGNYCEQSAKEVEAAGYELAFTTEPGLVRPGSNRFFLPRISPGGSLVKLKQMLRELR